MNFWRKLEKPIVALAPMEDVTDTVFRQVVASCGKPDVFFTEFTNVEGLESEGMEKVVQRLKYTEAERPIVAQIWGITPKHYYNSAKRIVELGFDGIDINMGCPIKKIIKHGACSALIKNPTLAKEIYLATLEGAGELPVSIKTRIGFEKIVTEDWISYILGEMQPALLTIHGRTTKEKSSVPTHWDEIGKAVKIRNEVQRGIPNKDRTLLIGNGDITSLTEAKNKVIKYGLDGAMIGRGIFQNPWIFNQDRVVNEVSIEERLDLLYRHTKLFTETWRGSKKFNVLKKYFKIYITGFDGAKEMRSSFMEAQNAEEVYRLVEKYRNRGAFASSR